MPNKPKETIHVVEDDPAVARLMAQTLEKFGFEAQFFATGADFLRRLDSDPPRLCVLDLGLPDMDGLDILSHVRSRHGFGLLIVTGRGDTHDRVTGLELGADDYMVKPFEPREFIARVRSILRRYREPAAADAPAKGVRIAEFAGWRFEPGNNALTSPDGETETLSMAEARLLGALLQRPNQILTREQLLGGRDVAALDRSIDLRISRLRKRLEENPLHPRLIKTVYGAGYLFSANVEWL
ncbi:response regulator transcription factor [Aromatoleum anaerobium]|uniref:Response regulator n=1 Tax=Aromatoleum anaerobium TaxID=182180 RepID=A0ABX1PP64_9RHOO|nr:response regulator transcription factor [Aromatoleum anaerobium]MCK0507309.1 response regulator transcription factor [Aromatoleum anaerobium]